MPGGVFGSVGVRHFGVAVGGKSDATLASKVTSGITVSVSKTGSGITVNTPLPHLPGVHHVSVKPEDTVDEFIAALARLDDSKDVADAAVRTTDGRVIARSTPMWQVARTPWVLSMGELEVAVAASEGAGAGLEVPQQQLDEAYVAVTQALLAIPERTTTFQNFMSLCRKALSDVAPSAAGAQEVLFNNKQLVELATSWKHSLHQQGVILHFDSAADNNLRETLFLQPHKLTADLMKGLDIGATALRSEIARTREELAMLETQLEEALATKGPLDVAAHKYTRRMAWLSGLGMVGQFVGLGALVYEVSWDVMEPAIYFLGLGYSVAFAAFFLRYKSDPEFDNIFGTMRAWRTKKLYEGAGFDPAVVGILEDSVARKRGDLNLLVHRNGDETS